VPANRSRTENWYACLQQIAARGGALEFAFKREETAGVEPTDLLWRCRLLTVTPTELLVEPPAAVGRSFDLKPGTVLVGAMTIGQNRWLFETTVLGSREARLAGAPAGRALTMSMPDQVERCARRSFMRVSTTALNLPNVQCWPLLDPTSVVPAETANRLAILGRMNDPAFGPAPTPQESSLADSMLLPSVGPSFPAQLMNISGGGLGLLVSQAHRTACDRASYLWLRVDLTPEIPLPMALTVRRSHTHLDAAQNLYLGVAVDFTHHTAHQDFVSRLLASYVDRLLLGQARKAG
jgi:hypothetical protein